jgi:adenylate cyclase class IV
MKYKEVETKYDASDIGIDRFEKLVSTLGAPKKKMMVSSYDDYFVNKDGNFVRYRYTDNYGELTIKRKTQDINNNERIEVNISTSGDNYKAVEAFCELLGYKFNFGIYKTCRIYWIDKVVLVWYVVYDKSMKELRRFIEIEADEDLEWASEEEAWAEVVKYEKLLEPLEITSRNRIKKSLFEMFQKDT